MRRIYLGGVNGTGGEGIQGGQVRVLPLHRLLSGWTVVNAAHYFGTDEGTYRDEANRRHWHSTHFDTDFVTLKEYTDK